MFLLHHDFETFSPVDIKSAGAYAYLQHPETEVLCLSYWLEDRPAPECFRVGLDDDPAEFLEAIASGKPVACWNAGFERAAWAYLIPRQFPHWPRPTLEQFHDIQAWALYHALPPALGSAGEALGLDLAHLKDKAGSRVMRKLSRPRKWHDDGTYERWTLDNAYGDFDALYAYCDQDVAAEAAIAKVLKPLPDRERRIWLMDQRINDRGIGLDLETVRRALPVIDLERQRLDAEMAEVTGGAVKACTQNSALVEWLNREFGWYVDPITGEPSNDRQVTSVAKDKLREMLADPETPEHCKAALEIRQKAGKSSLAKFPAMLEVAGSTGRAQGAFLYHRATTGRWGGQGTQPQNMPRPRIKAGDVALVVDVLHAFEPADAARMIDLLFGEPFEVLPWVLRGMFIPAEGCEFVGGDFSNIEGRVLAWLAGETWKLEAFRLNDTPILDAAGEPMRDERDEVMKAGPDLYRIAYANSFGVDASTLSKDGEERQIGKRQELQLGYQGGVGAFVSSQKQDGFSFDDLAKAVYRAADPGIWAEAERKRLFLQVQHGQHDWLPPMVYTALRYLTDTWRANNPAIKAFWYDLNECALNAVRYRGEKFSTANDMITYVCGRHFLYCKLPSGRVLHYARPSLETAYNEILDRHETVLTYWAHGKDRNNPAKFAKVQTYGGLLCENVTQAVARDVQAEAMLRLEAAGLPIVLHVHDEDRCEVPIGSVSPERVAEIMRAPPTWAAGLPIECETETMQRYHK